MKYCLLLSLLLATTLYGRVWTAKDGRTLEADMMDHDMDSVVVLLEDGRMYDIPFVRLIPEDETYARNYEAPAQLEIPDIEQSVVTIECGDGRGSGFIAQVDGKAYLYTNQHVIAGFAREDIVVLGHDGRRIHLGTLEIDPDDDVARIRIVQDNGLIFAEEVEFEDRIKCYGNSAGEGVVTVDEGQVLGIGGERIEVDAAIVPGNSGGPIVNRHKEVVGLATYIKRGFGGDDEDDEDDDDSDNADDSSDWRFAGTRYGKTRRFGLNLTIDRDFHQISWQQYQQAGEAFDQYEKLAFDWIHLCIQIATDPFIQLDARDFSDHVSIQNAVDKQNVLSEKRRDNTNDIITPSRLVRLNDEVRQELQEQYRVSYEQVLREMERMQSDRQLISIAYFNERNEETLEMVKDFHRELQRYTKRVTVFRFRDR